MTSRLSGTPQLPLVIVKVTSLGGVVHLVPDAAIAGSETGRYTASCGAVFMPAAMTEPDGTDACLLCRAEHAPPARRRRR